MQVSDWCPMTRPVASTIGSDCSLDLWTEVVYLQDPRLSGPPGVPTALFFTWSPVQHFLVTFLFLDLSQRLWISCLLVEQTRTSGHPSIHPYFRNPTVSTLISSACPAWTLGECPMTSPTSAEFVWLDDRHLFCRVGPRVCSKRSSALCRASFFISGSSFLSKQSLCA